MTNRIAIVILAAGASTRMGRSKQLLEIGDTRLLTRTTVEALKSNASEVWVVLGSQPDEHQQIIAHLDVEIVNNPNWTTGMGSSLKTGLRQVLSRNVKPDAVIFTVCDQPLLSANIFDQLIDQFQKGAGVVACTYGNATGVPTLFSHKYFDDLLQIDDHEGARKILGRIVKPHTIEFPGGSLDLDTPEDYHSFIHQSRNP